MKAVVRRCAVCRADLRKLGAWYVVRIGSDHKGKRVCSLACAEVLGARADGLSFTRAKAKGTKR